MQNPLFKKSETPNFNHPAVQQSFIEETASNKELMQKELSVNLEEQNLLRQRLNMMKDFINDLPASDPQYSMIAAQLQMDQIELDELHIRSTSLSQKLTDLP